MSNMSNNQNLAKNHSFKDLFWWAPASGNVTGFVYEAIPTTAFSRYGETELHLKSVNANTRHNGIYQEMHSSLPNGDYTFSAYVRVPEEFEGSEGIDPGVYLRVIADGAVVKESAHVSTTMQEGSSDAEDAYMRLSVSFNTALLNTIKLQILVDGMGEAFVDAVQLESGFSVSDYNYIENGNFAYGLESWAYPIFPAPVDGTEQKKVEVLTEDDKKVVKIPGKEDSRVHICQKIPVRTESDFSEPLVLSCRAKAVGGETVSGDSRFRLRAVIYYEDSTTETHFANFDISCEDWQSKSVVVRKSRACAIGSFWVYLDYDYCKGNAYFDDISLVNKFVPVESITLSPQTLELYVGDIENNKITATVYPPNASNKELIWSSSNPDNVGITAWPSDSSWAGVVYENPRDGGSATIYANATDGSGVVGSCLVTVLEPIKAETISVTPESKTLIVGETYKFDVEVTPSNITYPPTWESYNKDVATVDQNGVVTAHKAGTARIKVDALGVEGVIVEVVVDGREQVTINEDSDSFYVQFSDGLIWRNVGYDLVNYSDSIPQSAIDRANENAGKKFSEKQVAFLYLLDPLGVEYYVRNYTYKQHVSTAEGLFYKDNVYREIFGVKPLFFRVFPNGTIQYYDNSGSVSSSFRESVYSYAEVLFGEHMIYDAMSIVSFFLDVIKEIFTSLPGVSQFLLGVELYQALFFSGAVNGVISSGCSSFIEEYVSSITGAKAKDMLNWSGILLSVLSSVGNAYVDNFVPPNLKDLSIYQRVSYKDFSTSFIVNGNAFTMEEIIERSQPIQ